MGVLVEQLYMSNISIRRYGRVTFIRIGEREITVILIHRFCLGMENTDTYIRLFLGWLRIYIER